MGPDLRETAAAGAAALERATGYLFSIQQPAGYFKGELETNVTMDAEDLMLRQFLGISTPERSAAAGSWIRSQQRSDGTWANFYEGPADLSTTIEAYVGLRLAGDDPDEAHMAKAATFVREAGGLEGSRVFTRLWMALFGLWSWDDLPALPPEVIFLPPWFPLNIYDFSCWARQTIVALTVVAAYRPSREIGFRVDELHVEPAAAVRRPLRNPLCSPEWALQLLDKGLHGYERLARTPAVRNTLRAAALAAAERWIVKRQEADGSWGGIQPPWVYSLMALSLRGYPLDHPVIAKGLEGLEVFTIREEGLCRLEACQSPVWDTALAVVGLADAGLDASDERVARAIDWMLGEEVRTRGDWAVRRPALGPGGWAFEFANDNYPDIDDTAEVILAMRKSLPGGAGGKELAERAEAAIKRGRRWVEGMESRDGGWAAFDADNTRELCRKLPFCDFGAVIDPPSADVTAHVVEMLAVEAAHGSGASREAIGRGCDWLTVSQEADGSWFGRWGANYVYGTGAAVPALVEAGVSVDDPRIRRAVGWLVAHQNEDGGFGEDLRSYVDSDWYGRGASTASQTAWALLALVAAGEAGGEVACRAVGFLADTQRPDGGWDEPWFTGTGFPGDFYINYHLYRIVWPLSALGRWQRGKGVAVRPPPPFVMLCALAPEAVAVQVGLRRAGPWRGRTSFVGMGPLRAKKAAARLASVLPDRLPVVVVGVGGALVGGFEVGDLVVANALGTADDDGGELVVTRPPAPLPAQSSAFSDQVAAALSARFPSTRQAAVLSAGRTAKGAERAVLGESGAVLCDTESYWLSRLAERRPFAVVRSVVDSPERELVSLQTLTGGIVGLRRLSGVAEVLGSLLDREPQPVPSKLKTAK